jgi:hypothetical protein
MAAKLTNPEIIEVNAVISAIVNPFCFSGTSGIMILLPDFTLGLNLRNKNLVVFLLMPLLYCI